MAHLHSIYDSDLHFVIDPVTRVITNQSENKNSVIQFDHNSERFTFELPRFIEEHDMLSCNRVEVHYLNVESKSGNQMIGVYEVQDLQVSPHDDKVVICSWLVSNNATQYAGTLNFVLRFACVTGEVDYVWNTAVFKNFAIQNGLYNSEPVAEQYADVLAEWYQSLFTASDDGVTNIGEARVAAITAGGAVADERIADIERAGSDVIASLPPEYLEMVENMAPPIVETATGEAIAIRDSADRKLRGLTLYGKSTQDGTPTPEAPVEIESVENPTVRVCGKNLFDSSKVNQDYFVAENELHVDPPTYNVDIYTGIAGSSQPVSNARIGNLPYLSKGSYTLSFEMVFDDGVNHNQFMVVTEIDADGSVKDQHSVSSGDTFTLGEGTLISLRRNTNAAATIKNIQIECGDTATPYEPYTEQTLPITRALPGIPVASGGNYTDENGQQWVCDEVDFERGVYVQRTLQRTISDFSGAVMGSPEYGHTEGYLNLKVHTREKTGGYCDKFPYSASGHFPRFGLAGAMIYFTIEGEYTTEEWRGRMTALSPTINVVLKTPVETALTAEELAAYASLRSNYPNTSVLNDGGAGMTVAYVADTKLYIDKKLSV